MMASYSEAQVKSALSNSIRRLGISELRPQQDVAIRMFVHGRDVFVNLPTGSGKTLCYCCLPLVFDTLRGNTSQSVVVVVSPLIALMKDQVRAMKEKAVSAVYVDDLSDQQGLQRSSKVCNGEYQLVYMSPEALLTDELWRDMLLSPVYHENLVGLIVDEAHCVKKW